MQTGTTPALTVAVFPGPSTVLAQLVNQTCVLRGVGPQVHHGSGVLSTVASVFLLGNPQIPHEKKPGTPCVIKSTSQRLQGSISALSGP